MTSLEQAEELIAKELSAQFLDGEWPVIGEPLLGMSADDLRAAAKAILSALTTAPEPIRAALADAFVPGVAKDRDAAFAAGRKGALEEAYHAVEFWGGCGDALAAIQRLIEEETTDGEN